MKLKIAWLYYDLLELYGDRGNIKSIEKMLIDNKIDFVTDKITIGDDFDISNHDIVFLGGGSDRAQRMLYKDLIGRKQQIIRVMDQGGFILTICGGYQMFGRYYKDASGKKIDGLNIFDYYSVTGDKRCIGNVICEVDFGGNKHKIVGFENHGGETLGVNSPFAKVVSGHGNVNNGEFDGYMDSNFIGSYIHGSLLPKNPEITKHIIESVLKNKYKNNQVIDTSKCKYSILAKNVILERI